MQKRVMITGGASGLGKALVEAFALLGWKIAILDINLSGALQVAETVNHQENGSEAIALAMDVSQQQDFEKVKKIIVERWGGMDIIINNAGIAATGFLEDTTPNQWRKMMDINLDGVYRGCYFWRDLIPDNGPGHIVNIASFAGIALAPGMLSYNVSKAAVMALSESLRIELAYKNIGVSMACPAFFKTNLVSSMSESSTAIKEKVNQWMDASKIDAKQVAWDILKGIDKNKRLMISHDYARRLHLFKRFLPNYYIQKISQKSAGVKNAQK